MRVVETVLGAVYGAKREWSLLASLIAYGLSEAGYTNFENTLNCPLLNKKAARAGGFSIECTSLLKERLRVCEPLVHFIPVHHAPPGLQVVRAAVLVFQVIGVLPYVISQNRKIAIAHRIVLVRS